MHDYFVVPSSLFPAVLKVQRVNDDAVRPHHFVRLVLSARARQAAIRTLVCPAPLPHSSHLHGPPLPPPSYAEFAPDRLTDPTFDSVNKWLTFAKGEIGSRAGIETRHFPSYYKTVPLVPKAVDKHAGATAASGFWRALSAAIHRPTAARPPLETFRVLHLSLIHI